MNETAEYSEMVMMLSRCLLIFGVAGIIVPFLNKFKISTILGFLICGIALGPTALVTFLNNFSATENFVLVDQHMAQMIGEFGILALLFMIGLDLSWQKLRDMKHFIFGLGSLQIIVTGAIVAFIATLFHNAFEAAIIIGICFALSSTAITMKTLEEYNLHNEPVGQLSFSILLMQDLAIVPILVLIGVFSGGETQSVFAALTKAMVIAGFCISMIYFVGRIILRPLTHRITQVKNPDYLAPFTLFVVCTVALITHESGLSAALGAFLAGILLGETALRDKIKHMLSPLKTLLLGVFFVSVGMLVDIQAILQNPFWIIASVIGIFVIKASVIYPLCRAFKIPHKRAARTAVLLSEPGEFALMAISVCLTMGLLTHETSQFFLLVTVLGMLVTPFVLRLAPPTRMLFRPFPVEPKPE